MKYLVFCAAFFIGAQAGLLSNEEKAKIRQIHEMCMKETNVDPDIVAKAKKGEYVDDEKLKDQVLCFTQKIGFQDAEGKWQMDKIKDRLMNILKDESAVDGVIKQCIQEKDTPKESAFEVAKCLHQMAPKDEVVFDN